MVSPIGLLRARRGGDQKHQEMPASTIVMKMAAPWSIQDAKASPVLAARMVTPTRIFAAVPTGIETGCFIP